MEERAKFEEQEDDPPVAPVPAGDQEGPTTALVVGRRKETNHALVRNHFRDAAKMQHLVWLLLDNLNAGNIGRTVDRQHFERSRKQAGVNCTEASNHDSRTCKQVEATNHGNLQTVFACAV